MTNLSIYTPGVIEYLAEGSPSHRETPEPFNPLKTSLMPVIFSETIAEAATAETGTAPAVDMAGESTEIPEGQDAPRLAEELKTVAVAEATTQGDKTKAPVILIIEDTIELAEIIQATLERIQMVTMHETHGVRALAVLNERQPDVVLLDISLPDMTGWKILDAIKERHENNKKPMPLVIVITAYDDPANRLVGKLQGIYSYLIKPFTADEVEKAVTQALSGATR
jgi:CheY-like chemotaxis protein